MLAMMLQRITTLEGDAAAEEEEQSASALIETYIGEFRSYLMATCRHEGILNIIFPDAGGSETVSGNLIT